MKNLKIYCVTNKKLDFLERMPFKLVGVGKEKFSQNYIRCDTKDNIYYKEQYYSELKGTAARSKEMMHQFHASKTRQIDDKNSIG